VQCEDVYQKFPEFIDLEDLPSEANKHISTCLSCQAEMAHYKGIKRSLSQMQDVMVAPPVNLLADVLVAIKPDAEVAQISRSRKSRRRRTVSGIAAAVTAGAGVAIYAVKFANKHKIAS